MRKATKISNSRPQTLFGSNLYGPRLNRCLGHIVLMERLDAVLTLLDTYNTIMKKDIWAAIGGESRYLGALGLSTYTEVFGGLYRGDLSQNNSARNYNTFIENFFNLEYKAVDKCLSYDEKLEGRYKAVRCGLVHEYFIRDTLLIKITSDYTKCGIIYDPKGYPNITFVVRQYFKDLLTALNVYRERVKKELTLVESFKQALESVDSPMPKSYTFKEGT